MAAWFGSAEIGRTRDLLATTERVSRERVGGVAAARTAVRSDDATDVGSEPRENYLAVRFRAAGYSDAEQRKFFVTCCLSLAVVMLAGFATRPWAVPLGVTVVLVFFHFRLRHAIFSRAQAFESDYAALLLSVASGVRTGLDPLIAFSRSSELFPQHSEVRREITALNLALQRGENEEQAIQGFAVTIEHPDIPLLRSALLLARREGSSLAECLQRLARVTRQRQSFRRKIRSGTAMQRLSAFGIVGAAGVIGAIQVVSNWRGLVETFAHPIGAPLFVGGVVLIVSGIVWMLLLTRGRI